MRAPVFEIENRAEMLATVDRTLWHRLAARSAAVLDDDLFALLQHFDHKPGRDDHDRQDESLLNRAYRRVACNAIWLVRSESAWVEYLGCLGPGQLIPQ